MKKFRADRRGAVTVFVALLLVPATLICGAAVDIARMYAAYGALQDGNSLAANSALAGYNALLKDLYGLYGFMKDDPELGGAIGDYVKTAAPNAENITTAYSVDPAQNLREIPVLRRQVLDYMEVREPAPAPDCIFGFEHFEHDAQILELKSEIDGAIEEMLVLYKEFYRTIEAADKCPQPIGGISGSPFNRLTDNLASIPYHLKYLVYYLDSYKYVCRVMNEALEADPETDITSYVKTLENIIVLYGGVLGQIESIAATIRSNAGGAVTTANNFRPKFDDVVKTAKAVDQKKSEIKQKTDELEAKLNRRECSDVIWTAFTKDTDNEKKTIVGRYRDAAGGAVEPLAAAYKKSGNDFIDSVVIMLGDIRYREFGVTPTSYNSLTLAQLSGISSVYGFGFFDFSNKADYFSEFVNLNIVLPRRPPGGISDKTAFYAFEEQSAEHKKLFADLKTITEGISGKNFVDVGADGKIKSAGGDLETAQRASIAKLEKITFDDKTVIKGAKHIYIGTAAGDGVSVQNFLQAIDSQILASPPPGDFALVLSYGLAAFSCYATAKSGGGGKSVTGAAFSPKANYFYRSEAEYIFNGSNTAENNVDTVRELIAAVREIANNVAAFRAGEINTCVNNIRSIPLPLGLSFVLGEQARRGFAAAETAMDMARIRNGYKTAFFKDSGTWRCAPSTSFADPKKHDDAGLDYRGYMFWLFVTKANLSGDFDAAADDFLRRAGNLIEWNMVNYTEKVNANETAMIAALFKPGRFRLENAATGVTVTTTAEIQMFFLSSPFAQKGTKGIFNGGLPAASAGRKGY